MISQHVPLSETNLYENEYFYFWISQIYGNNLPDRTEPMVFSIIIQYVKPGRTNLLDSREPKVFL